jgi:hypothetical protein
VIPTAIRSPPRWRSRRSSSLPWSCGGERLEAKNREFWPGEDRAHPPAGRHPHPARPGVRATPARWRSRCGEPAPRSTSCRGCIGGTAVGTGLSSHPVRAHRHREAAEPRPADSRDGQSFHAQATGCGRGRTRWPAHNH